MWDIYTSHRNRAGEMHPQGQGLAPGSGVRPPRTHSCRLSQLKQQSQIPSPLTLASESRLAGSAGTTTSTVRVSTAITPTGIPPSLRGRAQVSQAGSARCHTPPSTVDSGVDGSTQPRLTFCGHAGYMGTHGGEGGMQKTARFLLWWVIFLEGKGIAPSNKPPHKLVGWKGAMGAPLGW